MLENHTSDLDLWLTGPGTGFGLGYGVVVDRDKDTSGGSSIWGGAYCTLSWIDPEKDLVAVIMTQVRPYTHVNIRQDFLFSLPGYFELAASLLKICSRSARRSLIATRNKMLQRHTKPERLHG